jgi:hypothetical protein
LPKDAGNCKRDYGKYEFAETSLTMRTSKGSEMKQLYVIVASGGSYDDAWENAEFVTDDLAKGQACVDKWDAFRDTVINARKKSNEFRTQWLKDNPRPICPTPVLVDVPRWDSKVKVTKEMRDERKRLEALNSAAATVAAQPYLKWIQDCYRACDEFEKTFPEDVQQGLDKRYDETFWSISEIAWLE